MKKNENNPACPSYSGKAGSRLLGVKQADGTIALLPRPIMVDDHFFSACADRNIIPEQHFRFTGSCATSDCQQWNGEKCTVISKVLDMMESVLTDEPLPVCQIRPNCTWYRQEKAKACMGCKFVVTET